MIRGGSGPATLLVHGPAGAGKGMFVDDLLATAMCEAAADLRPCNACSGCRQARARTHPDLVVASPERWRDDRGSGESIVGAARRWLTEVAGTPIAGRWRVILIEHADAANEQIQNALLKALEEPGNRQLFILVADDIGQLLPTIRSRCQALRIGPIAQAALATWLVEHEHLTDEQAVTIARLAGGRIGSAVGYARAPERVDWRRRTQGQLLGLLERGPADRMAAVRELLDDTGRLAPAPDRGGDVPGEVSRTPTAVQRGAAVAIMDAWVDLARDLAVAAAGASHLAVAPELLPEFPTTARYFGAAELGRVAAGLERIRDALDQNVSPRLALEVAMLEWPATTPRA
jgi:DNA polymerase-3 subunit delta'